MVNVLLPQIYNLDEQGRKVLLGLTYEETIEFAVLDAVPPTSSSIRWQAETSDFPQAEARWLELYFKHQAACRLLHE